MIPRPCISCGELIESGSRCPACTPKRAWDGKTRAERHRPAAWDRLSKRLRRESPFCESCGATADLVVDHVIPVSVAPELALAPENCRVLCRSENASRRATYTQDEARQVIDRLEASQQRRPTRAGRQRIEAARRAAATSANADTHA
ncbi:HNH endonuclease signature motif containing protein [Mycolicibacterium palauense]|uniref:HNH endonuclease signature motif containing protein n=1 Tax=Mycolicibacterium palauense TaxID=2034511 RepID=UPI000BFEC26A